MTIGYLKEDLRVHCARLGLSRDASIIKKLLISISPRFLPVTILRISSYLVSVKIPIIPKLFQLLLLSLYGIEVRPRCPIGPGIFFPHTTGTVVGAKSIGRNCTIFQGVTIGASKLDILDDELTRPTIEDDVIIGAGAKILGAVTVGSRSIIGANAVVTMDIPADSLVVSGFPSVKRMHHESK